MAAKRAVFFDFDGVLVDSWALHERSWREVLDRYQVELSDKVMAQATGWTTRETADFIIAESGLDMEPRELALEKDQVFSHQAWTDLVPMPGAVDALNRLHPDFAIAIT